jgi:adenylate cyclase
MLGNCIAYIKKNSIRILFGFLITIIFCSHSIGLIHIQAIDRLENFTYDFRINLTTKKTLDKRIVIIDIDEKSLKEQGRWPWNRKVLADLVDRLFDDYHVRVLGFDMIFAEPDESSGLKNIELIGNRFFKNNVNFHQKLNEIKPSLDYDQTFSDQIKNRPVVLGFYFNQSSQHIDSVGQLPTPSFDKSFFEGLDIGFIKTISYGANLSILQKNAAGAGHFNFLPDTDGILRKIPMLQEYQGAQYPSLSLAIAQEALKIKDVDPEVVVDTTDSSASNMYATIESLNLGDKKIPVDDNVSALIPFNGSFTYISATDILHQRIPKDKLSNVIALVGTTAPGLMDLRASPTHSVYPGVEAHASMIAGILDGQVKKRPAYIFTLELLTLMGVGLLLSLFLPSASPLWASGVSITILSLFTGSNLIAWQYANLVLPFASITALIVIIYVFNMSYGFFYESRGKRQLAGIFGQYVPPELVGEMAKNPENYMLKSESRNLTVLFSDVRGFTTISEGLDPKELSDLMNEYLTPMTKIIHANKGTIDKYMGDAIMAFWGAPISTENHASLALKTSLEMIKQLENLKIAFIAKGWPPINIGIGLNTGPMTVGNMGSSFRMAYTVMGDAVNLGSRIEGLTKEYGVDILVSEFTKAEIPDFVFREIDLVRVKGKDKPVAIFEPINLIEAISEAETAEIETYYKALTFYRKQEWAKAKSAFNKLNEAAPSRKIYGLYLNRIEYYQKNPPGADWDGAFTFKTK